ncbi:MAG: hypothetical protein JWQ79_1252, partial [Mucilaginibacter sp.]|nr:hypothetical protein [Mucilaginibacter sp.]
IGITNVIIKLYRQIKNALTIDFLLQNQSVLSTSLAHKHKRKIGLSVQEINFMAIKQGNDFIYFLQQKTCYIFCFFFHLCQIQSIF